MRRRAPSLFSLESDGYSLFDISRLDTFQPAFIKIKKILSEKDFSSAEYFRTKPYLETGGLTGSEIEENPEILALALDKRILSGVESYLGCRPFINHIGVWISRKSDCEMSGSQFFHLDHADGKQVKIFIPLECVTLEKGPLTFLDKPSSTSLRKDVGYNWSKARYRLKDSEVDNPKYGSKVLTLCPEVGQAIALDTCSCFHMGSRVSSEQSRVLLVIQYLTPFSFVYWGKRKALDAQCFELTQFDSRDWHD